MAAPRKSAPPRPRFVQHAKRPAWGVGRVTDVYAGLMRVVFADGVTREFREDVLVVVPDAEVPPELLAQAPAPPAAAATAARARPRKARAK
jgi:hypothetical protein